MHHLKNIFRILQFYPRLLFDSRKKFFILIYHRVLPTFYEDPWTTIVSEKTFRRQLDFWAKHFNILSLKELEDPASPKKKDNRISVVLTFDDVYWDSYDIILPILLQKGLPATFFVVTDFIEGKRPLWDRALLNVLSQKNLDSEISFKKMKWRQRWGESRLSFALRVFKSMKFETAEDRYALLDALGYEKRLGEPSVTWDQIRTMIQKGMEIGSHSQSHGSLSKLSAPDLEREIEGSKRIIEERTETPCDYFSFPYGNKNDFSLELVQKVEEGGYKASFLNIPGYHHIGQLSSCFRRRIITERALLRKFFYE